MSKLGRFLPVAVGALVAASTLAGAAPETKEAKEAERPRRWTAETPDAMVELARARAVTPKASERDVLAAMAVLGELAPRAAAGAAEKALADIAGTPGLAEDLRSEAAVLARSLAADAATEAGVAATRKLGVVSDLALLGPFRDTGGGLAAKEGPEKGSFADRSARYSWGTVEVAWRDLPPAYAGAAGVPLNLFVHPRRESCSYVATRLTLEDDKPVVVRLAATGQVRLSLDGTEVGRSEDVHASAFFDRLAGKLAGKGEHLVTAKVCAGALDDAGRVRLRVTAEGGASLQVSASAELRNVDGKAAPERAERKAERVVTALGRALGPAGATAGGDALLSEIVLRTLGGTDDLKSPRAPGALDTFTRGQIDPDRLAMAGWVAPSGANRSGWLNSARDRAATSNDTATCAFADRRLIAEHLQARMADWAMAQLRGLKSTPTPAGAGADHELTLLRAMTLEALGTEALRIDALRGLSAAADASPGAPDTLLSTLARLATRVDPRRERAVREALAKRGLERAQLPATVGASGARAVSDAARAAFAGGLDDVEDGLAAARAVSQAGDHAGAKHLLLELSRWSPNRPEVWATLAEELAASAAAVAERQAATMALRRARELAPGDAHHRAHLALREGGLSEAQAQAASGDERYLVPSARVLSRRQGAPPAGQPPEVEDRELYWLRAVVMHPDKRVSQLLHYAREVVIAPRTQDELYEDLPAEGDLTEILRARVHRKGGGTSFPLEEHNEGTRPRIRWPELEPGDTVEVAVRTWTSHAVGGRGDPPFYFMDYAGSVSTHPLLYNEVVVETTREQPLYIDVLHADGPPGGLVPGAAPEAAHWAGRREERDEGNKHVTRLVWEKPVVIADEPLAPALTETVPVIVGSTFRTWADFRSWYSEAIRGFTEPDAEVRRIAAELTKGKTTREAKLKALFDFVADDIRYVNYTSGEWWLPNRPHQLLARREGDCDDKAILLITLLRSVGIEAQEVMVQTRETGQPSVLLAKNAAIPMFDHGIAFLPGPGGGMYLDATSPQSRLGPIPSMDARARALRMDTGPAEIVELPNSSPEDHGANVTWNITLHPDGSGDLAGDETHIGDGAYWLRTYLTQPDARAQYVENNLVGGWFPTVQVDKKIEFEPELKNGAARVKYRAHSDGLARHEQRDLVVLLSPSSTLASQIAPLVRRSLPVSLPSYLAPSHQRRTTRIVAPPGFVWGDLPPGGDVNGGEFGSAHLEVTRDPRDPRVVVAKRSILFDLHVIPVSKYAAWRTFIQRIDALMHRGVRLVPSGAP